MQRTGLARQRPRPASCQFCCGDECPARTARRHAQRGASVPCAGRRGHPVWRHRRPPSAGGHSAADPGSLPHAHPGPGLRDRHRVRLAPASVRVLRCAARPCTDVVLRSRALSVSCAQRGTLAADVTPRGPHRGPVWGMQRCRCCSDEALRSANQCSAAAALCAASRTLQLLRTRSGAPQRQQSTGLTLSVQVRQPEPAHSGLLRAHRRPQDRTHALAQLHLLSQVGFAALHCGRSPCSIIAILSS